MLILNVMLIARSTVLLCVYFKWCKRLLLFLCTLLFVWHLTCWCWHLTCWNYTLSY